MSRIRTIKPEFFSSSDIVSLTPLSRLFYIALWCESDREGRLVWNTKTLKLRYFPSDKCDIESMGKELIDAGLIEIYQNSGTDYACIPTFKKHQVINNREAISILPSRDCDASSTRESGDQGEGKEGREGKGREDDSRTSSKAVSKKQTQLPEDFGISDRVKDWAKENNHFQLESRLQHFIGYAKSSGKKYLDWDQAFMNAIRDDWAKLGKDSPASTSQSEWMEVVIRKAKERDAAR